MTRYLAYSLLALWGAICFAQSNYQLFPKLKVPAAKELHKEVVIPAGDVLKVYHYYQRDLDIPTHFMPPGITSTHRQLAKKMNGGKLKQYNYIATVLPEKIDKNRNYEEFNIFVDQEFKINKLVYRYRGPQFRNQIEIFKVGEDKSKIKIDKKKF